MGNGNSIRAKRRARGKKKVFMEAYMEERTKILKDIKYIKPDKSIFEDFLTSCRKRIEDSLGVEGMVDYYKKQKVKNYLRGIYINNTNPVWVRREY